MTSKSLFDKQVKDEILQRLETLSANSQAQWGKMNVAQMLAHCAEVLKLAATTQPTTRSWMGFLIGGFFKKGLYNDVPISKNLPTAPNFKIVEQKEFEAEKAVVISLIERVSTGGEQAVAGKVHPFFGNLTPEQWGISQWKHLNHHFSQFGV